jgi:hypothetical protein
VPHAARGHVGRFAGDADIRRRSESDESEAAVFVSSEKRTAFPLIPVPLEYVDEPSQSPAIAQFIPTTSNPARSGLNVVQPWSPSTTLRTPNIGGKNPLSRRTRHSPSRSRIGGPRSVGRELAFSALRAEGQELAAAVRSVAPFLGDRGELVDPRAHDQGRRSDDAVPNDRKVREPKGRIDERATWMSVSEAK